MVAPCLILSTTHGYGFLVGENRGANGITTFPRSDGSTALIGNAFEIFEDCLHDVEAWIRCALDLGYSRVILQGHSLGCSKVAYGFGQLKPRDSQVVKGLILLSPADMLGLVESPGCLPLHTRLLKEAQEKKGEGLLSELLWDYAILSSRTYLNFFSPNASTAVFNYFNPSYEYKALERILVPVLALTGTNDDGILPACEPHRAMEILRAALVNSPRVETVVFDGADHDFKGFGATIVEKSLAFIEALP